jgi:hypothetical protein
VTVGDSYISGEAGRWLGNSASTFTSNGTDRACNSTGCSESRVYIDGTAKDGCHRSDVAEVRSARLAVTHRINIACSGALTGNVLRAAAGGHAEKTERPQDDQLAKIAAADDVRMVVLSIGGNDLGFATIAGDCVEDYELGQGSCAAAAQQQLAGGTARVTTAIEAVVKDIRFVMTRAGYRVGDYRLVVQTYPSVVPPASRARTDFASEGCPFYAEDLTWAHDQAVPTIDGVVQAAVAAEPGVELLDLRGLLTGHEACSQTTGQAQPGLPAPGPAGSEWGRYISLVDAPFDHYEQEFLHPNAYAQMALGRCLTQVFVARRTRRYSCTGTAGETPSQVRLAVG